MSDKSEKNGRRTSMGREDAKASNALLVGLGVGTVVAVTGLSVAGTVTAINAMNRQSEEAVAAAEAAVAQQKAEDAAGTAASETVPDAGVQDVIDWMSENGISFNEDGLPVDRDGNIVDNPFTDEDESLLAVTADEDAAASDADADVSADADAGTGAGSGSSGVSGGTSAPDVDTPAPAESSGSGEEPSEETAPEEPAVEPAVEPAEPEPAEAEGSEPEGTSAWYYNDDGTLVDGIQLDASGNPYYVVVKGDWLSRIASRYGFDDYNELAELSGIADPNWIYPGDVIYFPSSSGTSGSGSVAPGLG